VALLPEQKTYVKNFGVKAATASVSRFCSSCLTRAAAEKFWNEEPFAKNGGYARDARIVRWVFGD